MATTRTDVHPLWHGSVSVPAPAGELRDRAFVEGKGVRVRDARGRWYLDSRSSLRTVTLGYSCASVVDAIEQQLRRLPFAEIVRYSHPGDAALQYAERLLDALPSHYGHIRFTTSGSRMLEEAVVVSRFARVSGQGDANRTAVISNNSAWHGSGGIATSVTGFAGMHHLAGPMSQDFHHVPANSLNALTTKINELTPQRITAVVLEPVLGVGGTTLDEHYMKAVASLTQEHGIHLILDEVTTGAGRLGAMSFAGRVDVRADILVLGKGLTSGYSPISALAATPEVYRLVADAWPVALPHSSTNDGHPASMAAGLAVLKLLADGTVYRNVDEIGRFVGSVLTDWPTSVRGVGSVAGRALMRFLRLSDEDGQPWPSHRTLGLIDRAEDNGLLIDCVNGIVVFTPPLVTTNDEAEEMLDILRRSIEAS